MTPEVSVIIPTYNRRAMVREAVASVLGQRCEVPFELIVVDDDSTDGTAGELQRLAVEVNARVGAERMQIACVAHRGPAAARNYGVLRACAPLVAFLDSDDLWAPRKLQRQVEFMGNHPRCSFSQAQEIWLREGRRMNPGKRHQKRAGDIFVDSLRTCLISPSAVILRIELFREVSGFDEQMEAAEDYDLWLRILVGHEVGLLDEPLVTRRAGHPDQLSALVPALDRFRILALAKLLAQGNLCPARRDAAAEVLAEKCRIYARGLARRRHIEGAKFYEDLAGEALGRWRVGPDDLLADAIESIRNLLSQREPGSPDGARDERGQGDGPG
jgi:glycosyltransferase involved in cell wall biosynthesis